ncbi:alpha/beta hydrolase [Maricaulis parjimensis]|uniref:alpha/beta hydrolase n=1 Tax=Maricaulis parjimensis TaxID=144023 RepID=UPI00193ABCC2|nr:alpha/beta hydrolase-fold protein [Maricaulis parjimensis]
MRHAHIPAGTLHTIHVDSQAVAGNMLGDSPHRRIDVYVPHGHEGRDLPLLVDLVGFTSGGPGHTNWRNFGENVPERADRLIHEGRMKPCVIAFPDCFTRLGGNQYVNSLAMGHWDDFLLQEAIPAVEAEFGCGGVGKRGCFGKSSGGYGAMVHALLHPDFWSAAACHSGDMGFELMFAADFAHTLRRIAKHGGTIESFIEAWEKDSQIKVSGDDLHALMILAMAATYDPDPDAFLGIRLPVTMDTCERIPERWAQWMSWDPLEMLDEHADGLKILKGLFIDCGDIDQYNLVYGARRMNKQLAARGIPHVYEEFAGTHSSIDFRMDTSLPYLAKVLSD